MKQLIALSITFCMALVSQAQTDVYLNISHFLGSAPFALNTTATNNLGNQFQVSRLEYYVSEIKIVHDGGQEIPIVDEWILVNGTSSVNKLLGNFNITSLEAIKFSIGVDSAHNHLDPSQYGMNHPLAPKSPSMHWGWASGYRFVALEGKSGTNFSQIFEIHALGDVNYHSFTIPTKGTMSGMDLDINIKGDYTKSIYNIDVSGGLVDHGSSGEAANLLVNYSQSVFTSSDGNSSIGIGEIDNDNNISLYPNPSNGNLQLHLVDYQNDNVTVLISDMMGNIVYSKDCQNKGLLDLNLDVKSGVYNVNVLNRGEIINHEKLIILK